MSWRSCVLAGAVLLAGAQASLPDPARTPGALNPAVTAASIDATICRPGWTRTIRPPREYGAALKRRLIAEYGYADRRPAHYELDHLVPLSLGGAAADPRNLWPEPLDPPDGFGAAKKDGLELALWRRVCAHAMTLDAARQAIAHDWRDAYAALAGGERFAAAAPAPVAPDLQCPGDRLVWLNSRTGVYHYQGQHWFGATKQGRFLCERDALGEGDRATRNGE